MAEKWFTSDTHFFHENILFFKKEGGHRLREEFQSVAEMHETLIHNWNKVVRNGDYVYHLGDVTFEYGEPFHDLMRQLNGSIRLIVGNHDKIKKKGFIDHFVKVDLWKGFHDCDFTASHIPLRLESLRDGAFCVHGHTHDTKLSDPHYINVCVETRNYTPVHLDEIISEIKAV